MHAYLQFIKKTRNDENGYKHGCHGWHAACSGAGHTLCVCDLDHSQTVNHLVLSSAPKAIHRYVILTKSIQQKKNKSQMCHRHDSTALHYNTPKHHCSSFFSVCSCLLIYLLPFTVKQITVFGKFMAFTLATFWPQFTFLATSNISVHV